MTSLLLQEVDSLDITVIVDNELDPISPSPNPAVQYNGLFRGIHPTPLPHDSRGDAPFEFKMDSICCGAHGLSLMITATRGETKRTLLFDTGPEEDVWERNAKCLKADIGLIECIHLSHWHRDHSGGMLKAIKMINAAKNEGEAPVTVDLHPDRPDFRGIRTEKFPISLEADPSFEDITKAGAVVSKNGDAHTVLDDMFLVSGEIPRKTEYETGIRGGLRFDTVTREWSSDELIKDERLVMCNLKGKGLVVFTGCSHAGVVNASRHAVELGGDVPLYTVIGGFHLADSDDAKMQSSITDLKALKPQVLMPGHCTGWRFKFKIEQEMAGALVPCFTGTKYTISGV